MIVKNEEKLIARVLGDAAAVCDEMIVVDTGSTDRTKQIASECGARVEEIVWGDDFATARNASFAWCTGEWIMWLDADDVLPDSTQQAVLRLKETLHDGLDVVMAPYHYVIADDGTVSLNLNRERLIRRGSGLRWEGKVHEHITIPAHGTMRAPRLVVEHRPDAARRALNSDRNIRILEKEITAGHPTPRTRFYYANELLDHQRLPEAIQAYEDFLDHSPDPGPDRYWAWISIAECGRVLGDEKLIRRSCLQAIDEDPGRAEAYISLGLVFYHKELWAQAAPLFLAATEARAPLYGFARIGDYRYAGWDYLSVCFDRLGRRTDALTAAQRALPDNPEADRVKANMRWMIDNL